MTFCPGAETGRILPEQAQVEVAPLVDARRGPFAYLHNRAAPDDGVGKQNPARGGAKSERKRPNRTTGLGFARVGG